MRKIVYHPMDCPVCGQFYFSKLQEWDDVDQLQCSKCGWRYDYKQAVNPDLKDGRNARSVNEYRRWYEQVIAENPDYDYADEHCPPEEKHKCPVCHKHTFKDRNSFDICPVCGWVDDVVMEEEPDRWAGCSNDLCLNDFRERYYREGKYLP